MNLQTQVLGFTRRSAVQAARRVLGRSVKSQKQFREAVRNRFGLEIGGPSVVFADEDALPLYRYVQGLDNCVYSAATIWEGRRAEGLTFSYHPDKREGFNFIREATDLHGIADHHYDFLLASHSLEHVANPIKALKEWMRVVKPGGPIVVLLPDYRHTFDHRRSPTSIEHIVDDYQQNKNEADLTHLGEILELHDLARDPRAGSIQEFRDRSHKNFENRCLHHHVFDEQNSKALLELVGLTVRVLEAAKPHHIAIFARCPAAGT